MIISKQQCRRSGALPLTRGGSLESAIDRLEGARRRLFRAPHRSSASCSRSRPRGTLHNWDEMFTSPSCGPPVTHAIIEMIALRVGSRQQGDQDGRRHKAMVEAHSSRRQQLQTHSID